MTQALSADGFDADAYLAAWGAYREAVAADDAVGAGETSAGLVRWNCSYQRALGLAECMAPSHTEVWPPVAAIFSSTTTPSPLVALRSEPRRVLRANAAAEHWPGD